MPEPSWTSWVLADQSAMDACADELKAAGFGNTVYRPVDQPTRIQIDVPTDPMNPKIAHDGQAVVLMSGLLMVFTAEQYENSPFSGGGA